VADEKKPLVLPKEPYLPFTRTQNPAPISREGQQGVRTRRDIVDSIIATFQQVLPSNYVAQVPGPYYWLQFQALAEQIADVQLQLEDAGLESDVDFARPEYLWQMIGTLVFPDISEEPSGIPEVDGDLTYREFLRRMILLLLQGATQETVEEGLNLLTEAVVQVLAKVDYSHREISAWGFGEQHEFEINVLCQTIFTDPTTGELITGALGTGFPEDPFRVLRNNLRILRALRPAKSLYEYRHLFLDAFGALFTAEPIIELDPWYYEDFRKFCCGMKELTGDAGQTLGGLVLFSDPTRDFSTVPAGATLEIFDGPNSSPSNGGLDAATLGRYRVVGVRRLLVGFDGTQMTDPTTGALIITPTPRPYTTSPTGLTGEVVTVLDSEGVLEDSTQDFSDAAEGEIIMITEGPNAGSYRLETLLGNNGGPVGLVPAGSGATQVRVAPSILQTHSRMPQVATGQSYAVSLERLGVRTPFTVLGEDASAQFYI
jgi:hypothetical protein